MRYKMQLNRKILAAITSLLSIVAVNAYATDTQFSPVEYTTGNFEQDVNPGLYPPLSSGEASPWQDGNTLPAPDLSGKGNPWGARSNLPANPKSYGVPVAPANPYYGYRVQPQTPYYYPPQQQGYGYAPPTYGYAPSYPQMPYGNYGAPFNAMPFGGMPFNGSMPFNGGMPFSNGGYSPFGFSMPWSF